MVFVYGKAPNLNQHVLTGNLVHGIGNFFKLLLIRFCFGRTRVYVTRGVGALQSIDDQSR